MLASLLSYLPAAGRLLPTLGIVLPGYLCAMSVPWLIAAMIATLSHDKQRARQARQALRAMRRSRPHWRPRPPKTRS